MVTLNQKVILHLKTKGCVDQALEKEMGVTKEDEKKKKNDTAHDFLIQLNKRNKLSPHVKKAQGNTFKAWSNWKEECGIAEEDCDDLASNSTDLDLKWKCSLKALFACCRLGCERANLVLKNILACTLALFSKRVGERLGVGSRGTQPTSGINPRSEVCCAVRGKKQTDGRYGSDDQSGSRVLVVVAIKSLN